MGFSEAGRLLAALLLVCSVVGAVPAGGAGGGAVRAEATGHAGPPAVRSEAGLETPPQFSLTV